MTESDPLSATALTRRVTDLFKAFVRVMAERSERYEAAGCEDDAGQRLRFASENAPIVEELLRTLAAIDRAVREKKITKSEGAELSGLAAEMVGPAIVQFHYVSIPSAAFAPLDESHVAMLRKTFEVFLGAAFGGGQPPEELGRAAREGDDVAERSVANLGVRHRVARHTAVVLQALLQCLAQGDEATLRVLARDARKKLGQTAVVFDQPDAARRLRSTIRHQISSVGLDETARLGRRAEWVPLILATIELGWPSLVPPGGRTNALKQLERVVDAQGSDWSKLEDLLREAQDARETLAKATGAARQSEAHRLQKIRSKFEIEVARRSLIAVGMPRDKADEVYRAKGAGGGRGRPNPA